MIPRSYIPPAAEAGNILVLCFQTLRKSTTLCSSQYTSNLAISKSRRIHSLAFDKSMNTVSTYPELSSALFHYRSDLKRAYCVLRAFLKPCNTLLKTLLAIRDDWSKINHLYIFEKRVVSISRAFSIRRTDFS